MPALAATAVLALMHRLFSAIALHWHGFGTLIEDRSIVVVRDGEVDRAVMDKAHMTDRDLWEDLRAKGITRLDQVAEARLERSGQLSVVRAPDRVRVMEVNVAQGVQTVRIEIA